MNKKRKNNGKDLEKLPRDTFPKGHQTKKLSKGTVFNTTSKIIILNVYKYFRTKSYDVNVSEAVRLTVEATGCSPTSVYQLRKEESSKEGLREPSKKRIRKGVHKLSRDLKYDDAVRTAIRNIVEELKSKEVILSLTTILHHIKITNGMGNEQLQSMAPWTLRRLIYDIGFVYKKDGKKKILVDKEIEKRIKKPRVRKKNILLNATEAITPFQNKTNSQITNTFNTTKFEDKNEYMFYNPVKTNNVIIQLHHQSHLTQEDTQSEMCNATLSNNIMLHMPPPIISSFNRNMELLPPARNDTVSGLLSPKLIVLTPQSSIPWS